METTIMTARHETHTRYENLRLIEAVIGRRSWDDDVDNCDGIVSQYPSEDDAKHAAKQLTAHGLTCSTSKGGIGTRDEGKGYLWVLIGERE